MKEESLEQAIENVSRLRRDLSAKIVLHEEVGYSEFVEAEAFWAYGNWSVPCDRSYWIVTQPEESIPDTDKRETAKRELTEIFRSSEWYSARYAAGLALFKESQFKDNVNLSMYHIRKGLDAVSGSSPDDETRVNTVRDVAKLYLLSRLPMLEEELEKAYASNESKPARIEAGKQIGYPDIRIRIHEIIRRWI